MKTLLLIILFCLPIISNGQDITFIKSYGNNGYDYGRDIKQDVDTGYIATGSSSSFLSGNADAFLLKVDSLGNFKWSYPYGGSGADWGEAVVVTLDSSYAVGGYTNSFGYGGFDFYLIRTDRNGVPLWEKTYGGTDWERAHDLIQLPDSGFVLVGETYSYGSGNMDVYMVRTDKNGDTLWTKTYGGTDDDYANAVLLDGDSLVIVGGTTSFGAGMTDGLILKYHINGTFGWAKVAGREREDYFTSIVKRPSTGDYIIGGTRDYSQYLNNNDGQDFWGYYITNSGQLMMDTSFWTGGQSGEDFVFDVAVNESLNSIYYAGSTTSWGTWDITQGYSDAFISRVNFSNSWQNYVQGFGTEGNDIAYALDNCYDNGMVAIGDLKYNSSGGYNLFIAKIDDFYSIGQFQVTQDLTNEVITLSITDLSTNTKISAYPTLFKNQITLEGLPLNNQINVYNYSGQLIYSKNNVQNAIDLSNLSKGGYILTIQTDDGYYSTKIIKN